MYKTGALGRACLKEFIGSHLPWGTRPCIMICFTYCNSYSTRMCFHQRKLLNSDIIMLETLQIVTFKFVIKRAIFFCNKKKDWYKECTAWITLNFSWSMWIHCDSRLWYHVNSWEQFAKRLFFISQFVVSNFNTFWIAICCGVRFWGKESK